MLFCSSYTQSERFRQTDQLIIRLQVVVVTNLIRMLMRNVFMNVFKSDAVIFVGSDLPQYLTDVWSTSSEQVIRSMCPSSSRSTTRLLVFLEVFCNIGVLQVSEVHRVRDLNCFSILLGLTDDFRLWSHFLDIPH